MLWVAGEPCGHEGMPLKHFHNFPLLFLCCAQHLVKSISDGASILLGGPLPLGQLSCVKLTLLIIFGEVRDCSKIKNSSSRVTVSSCSERAPHPT